MRHLKATAVARPVTPVTGRTVKALLRLQEPDPDWEPDLADLRRSVPVRVLGARG